MTPMNSKVRKTYTRYTRVHGPNVAEILTGRDLDLCLGTVRQALADPNFDPQPGVCPLPNSHA